jgi:hypothetical protein
MAKKTHSRTDILEFFFRELHFGTKKLKCLSAVNILSKQETALMLHQGTLIEWEGSVQLTSSLGQLVL